MSFNLDPLKQTQEVIFSRERNQPHHPYINFSSDPVKTKLFYQKHLEIFRNSKLDFDQYIKWVFDKNSNSIGLIRNVRIFLPRHKSFIRPYLDYGDITYGKAFIVSVNRERFIFVQNNLVPDLIWSIFA